MYSLSHEGLCAGVDVRGQRLSEVWQELALQLDVLTELFTELRHDHFQLFLLQRPLLQVKHSHRA